jgi:hypothetical protein
MEAILQVLGGRRKVVRMRLAIIFVLALASVVVAQNPAQQSDTIDKMGGRGTSLVADKDGNLHVSYTTDDGQVKYAFRPAGAARWFVLTIATTSSVTERNSEGVFTRITVDANGNPYICYTNPGVQYANYAGGRWQTQQLMNSVGVSGYACGIAISPNGTPHVSWYQERDAATGQFDLHLKYAVLTQGTWRLKTLDYDTATGKWNQLVVDEKGFPHIAYSAFVSGHAKYAFWDGKDWHIEGVEAPLHKTEGLGMGDAIVIDSKGQPRISYYDEHSLKYAYKSGDKWIQEKVDMISPRGLAFEDYRSSIALDSKGMPYICYENAGSLKLAYFDGKKWNKQIIAPAGSEEYLFSSIAIGPNDVVYVAYRDTAAGSLVLFTMPRPAAGAAAEATAKPTAKPAAKPGIPSIANTSQEEIKNNAAEHAR